MICCTCTARGADKEHPWRMRQVTTSVTAGIDLSTVVKGKRVQTDRSDAMVLLNSYRTAKAGAKIATEAADEARNGLLHLVGDGDTLVDDRTGIVLCTLPVRTRTGLPPVADLLAEFVDMPEVQERIEALVRTTLYRAVAK